MNIFTGRLDIKNTAIVDEQKWQIDAILVDKSGNFFAKDISLNDIVYVDGTILGEGVLRYRVDEIISTNQANIVLNLSWDTKGRTPVNIFSGATAIIGRTSKNLKLAAMTSGDINSVSDSLLSAAKNYETVEILDEIISNSEKSLGLPTEDGQVLSSNLDGTRQWVTLPSISDAINLLKGQANGLAELDENGQLPETQLPSLAILDVFDVNSESEMLQLTSLHDANKGDIAQRLDTNEQYILKSNDSSLLSNWVKLSQPIPVESVNGKTGSIVLTTSDIAEGSNLYYTDERVANSPAVKTLQSDIANAGDMKKSVYDKDDNNIVDTVDSINWSQIVDAPTIPDTSNLATKTEVALKADIATTYTKTEVDTKIAEIPTPDTSAFATKTEVANKADVATTYTKTEVDALIPDTSNLATKTEVASKADTATTYTKTEVNALIPDISNLASKTELDLKADKTTTYTKTEVDTLIPDVSGLATKTEVDNKIAAIPIPDTSNLATKTEVALKADIATTYTKTEVDTKIAEIPAPDTSSFATKTELANKADTVNVYAKTETYNKTEIEGLMSGVGGGIVRYEAVGSTSGDCIVLASGEGVSFTKTGNSAAITCPDGVYIISLRIRFTSTEIGSTAKCTISYGPNTNLEGTGNSVDRATINPPIIQVINDVPANSAYKLAPPPASNLNVNNYTIEVTGLPSNIGTLVKLAF